VALRSSCVTRDMSAECLYAAPHTSASIFNRKKHKVTSLRRLGKEHDIIVIKDQRKSTDLLMIHGSCALNQAWPYAAKPPL
jgi:hypothetical protein